MATQDYSPHLKRVLRSYQTSSLTSLHGPGPNSYPGGGGGGMGLNKLGEYEEEPPPHHKLMLECPSKHDLYREISFKKALLYDETRKNKTYINQELNCAMKVENNLVNVQQQEQQRRRREPSGSACNSSSHTIIETQCHQQTCLPSHGMTKDKPGEVINLGSPVTAPLNERGRCKSNVNNCDVNSICNPPSKSSASTRATACDNGGGRGGDASPSSGGNGVIHGSSWVEPTAFLAPAPFPPQPLPVLAAADKGSPVAGGSRGPEETILDGEPIACFNVGGEKRLCLPQVLNTVLRDFSLHQINTICDELRIFCSRCTPSQLDALRLAGVLPQTATSCGLITNTDAQRLTQALLYTHPSHTPAPAPSQPHPLPQVRVYHTCFGKCKGLVWDEIYTTADSAFIECEECHGMFTPTRFVCHAHRALENQTIHWGFEAENWRTYLLLAKDQRMPVEKAEALLKAIKNKFDPLAANYKRKQDGVEVKEELPKKVRAEDTSSSSSTTGTSQSVHPSSASHPQSNPYGTYDPLMLPYVWRNYVLTSSPSSWPNAPLLTREGKHLPPPPLTFVRDSLPAELPPYLSQGPPVLQDPGRVVPLSDSQKFERHYQPNVALAPPKVRDKAIRENFSSKDVSPKKNIQDVHKEKLAVIMLDRGGEGISKEVISPVISEVLPSSPISPSVDRCTTTNPQYSHQNKICSPDTSSRHPELELSTTDSDTDSVASLNNHNETVEEAEGILRGWSDRQAAAKVTKLVAGLVARIASQDRHIVTLKRSKDAQMRDHNQTVSSLRNQLLTATQNKDDKQLQEKVRLMESELRSLREKLCSHSSLSVITPTTLVKAEPKEVDIKSEPIDVDVKFEPIDATDKC